MLRWKIAQVHLLALACILHRQQQVDAAYSPAVVRIDTGSSNGPFTDAGGNVWASDSNNNGGSSESSMSAAIDNTEDSQAAVYQTNRIASSFTYAFGPVDGLLPGQTYTLALHFVELHYDEEQQRVFDVKVLANGQMTQALTDFDIYHAGGGMYTAFTYQDTFTLGLDAMLSVYFVATEGQATVAGIEIMLPAVLRIDAGSTSSFSDELAPSPREWQADDFFTGSGSDFQSGNIANAADGSAGVYRSYHSAPMFAYTLGPENGLVASTDYVAVLHFAELPDEGVTMQAGDRLFDVSAQGKDILVDFDVFEEAGGAYTAVREHFKFTTDQTGVVTITFVSVGANHTDAILAGLEVYPALEGVPDFVATNSSSDSPAASPILSPAAAPGPAPASSADTATAANPPQSALDRNAASPMPSAAAGPSMAPADSPASSPAASSMPDIYQLLIEGYMASLMPSPAATSGLSYTGQATSPAGSTASSPIAAPAANDDTSAAPAVAVAPDVRYVNLEQNAATVPAAAPAPGDHSLWDPAASPVADMTTTTLIPHLALPPLQFLDIADPAAGPSDALAQVCQDMYSTYVDFISAQASFLLSQKVLQPQQLTESYLAGISAQNPLPPEQNPVSALLGGSDLNDYPACAELSSLMQIYYDIMILLQQAGAPASAPGLAVFQAPATAPMAAQAPLSELAPQPMPMGPIINYDGKDMPADDACQLMMVDVNQGIGSVVGQLLPGNFMVTCQAAGSGGVCGQVLSIIFAAEEVHTPTVEEMQELGFTDPAQCPICVQYLKQDSILEALLELFDQITMAPGPGPMPDVDAPQTAPAMAPAPTAPAPAVLPPAPSPAPGPLPDPCTPRPVPTLVAPRYSSATMVSFQLSFPAGYSPPSCAPDCLISLACGEASLDPSLEGYTFSKSASPAILPNGNYPLTLFFPSAAQYPAPGVEPPIITSCMSYAAQPCDSSALTHLGDITFDATRPTLTITKVSEQFGDPTASTAARKLQQIAPSPPLFALMLFNFSKAVGNFSADDILLTGGTVTEIIPVPDTYEYFVWVQVTSGTASLHIAVNPGSITDAAGNILYSDPTSPQIFTIVSSDGQYSGIITYPSPPPPPSTVSAMATAAAQLLSKGAIAGIVIGVFFGVLIVVVIVAVTFGIMRRRRTLQGENNIMAEATSKTLPPKTVTFTGPPGPSKGI